ncbi:MAG: TonB-dependent receptor [Bacteroidetes bacterium]|nr:MAG: TonB-dependent receptor [Bacteroidota bacterium]MBL1145838.1 TonB-dependent receptor [Bacteroidota bacterium]NOG58632.1 TonB-dependent receptor [Bacteroidota bacterium]
MRKLLLIACILFFNQTFSQHLTQTIRGTILDKESEFTLPGASVLITSLDPFVGVSTDASGNFEFKNIPVGRHTLQVSFMGYETVTVANVLVGSAKELILKIALTESLIKLDEVVVSGSANKEDANNEMATVSARSFSVEETSRYAASVDDPARMAQAFAGVSTTDDVSNEIIVRGNSPRGLLWRLNGIEIPSPNHFSDVGASGGGISVLSNNMLDNSDFFTAAFPAEYGNAMSGVFDINLRKGNQHKREQAFQLGLLGTDISAEGPLRGENQGSYLINYRYSTLSMLTELGFLKIDDNNLFQDLAFNFFIPSMKYGNFSLFGIGGLSLSEEFPIKDTTEFEPGEEYSDGKFNSDMGVIGLDHKYFLNQNTYIKSVISVSTQRIAYWNDSISKKDLSTTRLYSEEIQNTSARFSTYINKKFNVKNNFRGGLIASRLYYNLNAQGKDNEDNQFKTFLKSKDNTETYQLFGQWKHSFNEKWVLNAGVHNMYFALNQSYSVEPRLGLKWKFAEGQALSLGTGLHSRLEAMSIYMAKQQQADGSYIQPNKKLGLTKAWHYVVGYDRMLNEFVHLKTEVYFQSLFNVPVEEDPSSPISAINANAGFTTDKFVNHGTAYNIGTEITLERFFAKGYYYMFTGSIFDSKYKANNGKTYNTRFNANYRFSLLGGKEYAVGKDDKNLFSMNFKGIWAGGNRYTPIDLESSKLSGQEVKFEDRQYQYKVPNYWRIDITASYRVNRVKVAHILSLQVQNVTNRENVFGFNYNNYTKTIEEEYQFGILPILKYRLEF